MTLILEKIERAPGLVINAPSIFARKDFVEWLNDETKMTFTWHPMGEDPQEYSDTIVLVAENYDGDSSDMPEDIWKIICDEVYDRFGGPDLNHANGMSVTVRLTNL